MKRSVFIDSDVLMDLFADRQPYAEDASKIMALIAEKKVKAATTALVIANIYYILRKFFPHQEIIFKLRELLNVIEILSIDKKVVLEALDSDFTDFEDALQNYSLNSSSVKTIVTRNIKDYKKSEFAVLTPADFIKSLQF